MHYIGLRRLKKDLEMRCEEEILILRFRDIGLSSHRGVVVIEPPHWNVLVNVGVKSVLFAECFRRRKARENADLMSESLEFLGGFEG